MRRAVPLVFVAPDPIVGPFEESPVIWETDGITATITIPQRVGVFFDRTVPTTLSPGHFNDVFPRSGRITFLLPDGDGPVTVVLRGLLITGATYSEKITIERPVASASPPVLRGPS